MAILEVHDIHTYYGDAYVLQGLSLKLEQGQILGLLGPQRRRQDHAGQLDRRLHAAAPRPDRVQGRRHHRYLVVRDHPQRHGPGAAGAARVSDAQRRGKPAGGRAQRRPARLESRSRLCAVSASAGAADAARQDALGRRAADACHRPRADDQPGLPDHGRAVRGAGAHHHPGRCGRRSASSSARACPFCWSSRMHRWRSSWSTMCTS